MPAAPKPDLQAPQPFQIHGVLVRVSNVGVLLLGESGSGKSRCAFDLIRNGHKLVADDVVEIFEKEGVLFGRPTDFTRGLMEIRGVGIVEADLVFGEEALCHESSIELCVELNLSAAVDRFGAAKHEHALGEQIVPKFIVPAHDSVDVAAFVETAVRNYKSGIESCGTAAGPAVHPQPFQE